MATFIVNTALDDSDDNSILSLREAIALANSTNGADIISFDASLFGSTILLTQGALLITDSVSILGLGPENLTIDAQGDINDPGNPELLSRVFEIDDGDNTTDATVEIYGLTITGGRAEDGAGIFNAENLTLINSTVKGNKATGNGGGIYNSLATAIIIDSTIDDNEALVKGGGIFNSNDFSSASSTLSNNSSGSGGGFVNDTGATAILVNTTLSGNSATSFGGGVFSDIGSSTNLINTTVTGNSANSGGGGINAIGATVSLTNSLIAGNSITNDDNAQDGAEIASTVSNIQSGGGNLFGHSGLTSDEAFQYFTPGGADINATSSGGDPTALDDILDPTLNDNGGPTQTHALDPDGPAVDGGVDVPDTGDVDNDGNTSETLPEDQRGSDRDDDAIDIGAYEECFLAGTRILTDQGEVPVEDLKIGDRVQTLDGTFQSIKWMGRQTREPNQIRRPLRGYPIQIKAGALGNNLPHRDLFVSPDHAILFEELLINAGALVNDSSILKTTPTSTFVYYHIELEQHCLLVAEGIAAESYLPQQEDRLTYDNGAEYEDLYPSGSKIILWPLDYPRVSSAVTVPRYIRKRLRQIAAKMGLGEQVA